MASVHTVIVDWDGTAVPQAWPDKPKTFMPGFVEAMRRLHAAGHRIVIQSARYNPYDPRTGARLDPSVPLSEIHYIRHMLDRAGLTFVDIWHQEGKPSGSVYIDDKAERYNGCTRCWDRVTDKVLTRLGGEAAMFPRTPFKEVPPVHSD